MYCYKNDLRVLSLVCLAGRKWQVRRKILTPAFHFNVLQQFTNIFIEESERLIELLRSEGKPVVKDLLPLVSEHTLNVICGKFDANIFMLRNSD